MRNYTDSRTVEHHDDGSKTVTTVETFEPVSRKQQATAFAALGLLAVAPVVPILAIGVYDRIQEKREDRRRKKLNLVQS